MRPFILRGDKTSHGGTVISGASVTTVDGKAMVRVGDKATCPKKGHGGTCTVISGDPTFIVEGAPVARHGDKTSCGATLLASQGNAGVE